MNDTVVKGLLVFAGFICLILFLLIFSKPTRKYRLPNGKVVACASLEETTKGNYILKDCDDGIVYHTNGTVEELP